MRNLYKGHSKDASYQVSVHNFIWPSGFRKDDFLEINQSETRIACDAMFVNGSELNEESL
jgi:hypothetical protein